MLYMQAKRIPDNIMWLWTWNMRLDVQIRSRVGSCLALEGEESSARDKDGLLEQQET